MEDLFRDVKEGDKVFEVRYSEKHQCVVPVEVTVREVTAHHFFIGGVLYARKKDGSRGLDSACDLRRREKRYDIRIDQRVFATRIDAMQVLKNYIFEMYIRKNCIEGEEV